MENRIVFRHCFSRVLVCRDGDEILINANRPVSLKAISKKLRLHCKFPQPPEKPTVKRKGFKLFVNGRDVKKEFTFFSLSQEEASAIAWAFAD